MVRRPILIAAIAMIFAATLAMVHYPRNVTTPAPFPFIHLELADGMSCDIYLPPTLDRTKKHPLVFGSAPNGIGHDVLIIWHDVADRNQWIIAGSNNYKNGPTDLKQHDLLLESLSSVVRDYPVDPARVYAAGLSGGAMNSYSLIAESPEMFRGVIVNTGMMPHRWPGNPPYDPSTYPRNKVAVMMASPKDFRWNEMHADRKLLEDRGWTIDWIEFPDGHHYAPPDVYLQAAAWLDAH